MLTVFRELLINLVAGVVADLSSPTGMIGYIVSIGIVAYLLIGWHRRRKSQGKHGVDSWYLISLFAFIAFLAMGITVYGITVRTIQPTIAKEASEPHKEVQPSSILVAERFYSAQNKEEVSGRLDRISETINKADQEILIPAQNALLLRFIARPQDAESYLKQMDEIRAAASKMNALFVDDIIAKERDYRQEMNKLLFPTEPLVNFMLAADEYRNGISVYIMIRNRLDDDEARRGLHQLIGAAARSFGAARDGLLKWLSERQELIAQTRRALRS